MRIGVFFVYNNNETFSDQPNLKHYSFVQMIFIFKFTIIVQNFYKKTQEKERILNSISLVLKISYIG